MIFVPVGQKDRLDLAFVLDQIGEIRDNEVDAVHFFVWKRQTRINDDCLLYTSRCV